MIRGLRLFALSVLFAHLGPFGFASAADSQQPASPRRIGVLLVGFSPESTGAQQYRQGLRDAGYAEGRDVVIEWQYAKGDYARVPELAAELVKSKVDVIVVESTPAAQSVQRATSSIPVVMAVVGDPVGAGLVANLAHPGGNVTGLSLMTSDLSAKRLQLFNEAIPQATRVAVLWDPDTMGCDHPITWCRDFDGGRSWYTALGHTEESDAEPTFLVHLLGGIQSAAGVYDANCAVGDQ